MKIIFNTNPVTNSEYVWYIVNVPEYCESGLQIAKFCNGQWLTDTHEDITSYVKGSCVVTY